MAAKPSQNDRDRIHSSVEVELEVGQGKKLVMGTPTSNRWHAEVSGS